MAVSGGAPRVVHAIKMIAVMALYLTVGPTLIVTNKKVLKGLKAEVDGVCRLTGSSLPAQLVCLPASKDGKQLASDYFSDKDAEALAEFLPSPVVFDVAQAACAQSTEADDGAGKEGSDCHYEVDRPFAYPLTVAGLGLLFTSVFSLTVVKTGLVALKPENRNQIDCKFYATRIFPVGVLTAATMSFGNAVYLHLTVSFIQMLKAFTPAIVMIVLCVMRLSMPTRRQFACVIMITIGTVVSSLSELDLNLLGMVLMFGAELAEAIRLAMTQFLLKNKKFSIIEGQFFLAPPSCLSIFTAAAVLEWPTIAASGDFAVVREFWYFFVAAGCLGLLVNFCGFLVIQVTSSIVLKLLGVFRTALFVLVMVVFGGEVVTTHEALGYGVSLLFFFLYNYLKMVEKTPGETETKPSAAIAGSRSGERKELLSDDGDDAPTNSRFRDDASSFSESDSMDDEV